jgi:site-specific DNA-adenine methylase
MVNKLLKRISKTDNAEQISELIRNFDFGAYDYLDLNTKVNILILRALTDKGFKSLASMLSQEFYNDEDMDGDNQIYGKDFHFKDPPYILQQIPKNGKEFNWEEYKKSKL